MTRMENIETLMMLDRILSEETRYICLMTSLICDDDQICVSDGSDCFCHYTCPYCWVEKDEDGWIINWCMIEEFQEEYMEDGVVEPARLLR